MRHRAPIILSGAALVVAVLGATPLGRAAGGVLFAKQAGNAAKLNGHRSSLAGAPRTIPVVGANGKLPARLGAIGPQGPAGPQGTKGETGPIGPSDGYFDTNNGPVTLNAGPATRVGTVSIPGAGTYVLWGKAVFTADASHVNMTSSFCSLATAETNQFDYGWAFVPPGGVETVSVLSAQTFDSATAVNLYCNVNGLSTVGEIKLAAIKVGSLKTTTG